MARGSEGVQGRCNKWQFKCFYAGDAGDSVIYIERFVGVSGSSRYYDVRDVYAGSIIFDDFVVNCPFCNNPSSVHERISIGA